MKSKGEPRLLRGLTNVLEFGKHKGEKIQDVMKSDPNWIHWALQNIPTFKLNPTALKALPPQVKRVIIPVERDEDGSLYRDADDYFDDRPW